MISGHLSGTVEYFGYKTKGANLIHGGYIDDIVSQNPFEPTKIHEKN